MAEFDWGNNNKNVIEKRLVNLISQMCATVGLQPAEWDIDRELLAAIKSSRKVESLVDLCQKYDSFYEVAGSLNVELNPIYSRFKHLHTPAKSIKSKKPRKQKVKK